MIRNSHRPGRYLMVDDESGLTYYDDEMVRQWDGAFVHIKNVETRHPQEFVKARSDPRPLKHVRPAAEVSAVPNVVTTFVGSAGTVRAPYGPAAHLFDPAIPDMAVGTSFIVR